MAAAASTIENFDVSFVYEDLTADQKAAVVELSQLAETIQLPPSYQSARTTNPALFFTRFLYARKWIVQDAFAMLRDASQWRLENKIDTRPLFPSAIPVRGFDQNELLRFHGSEPRPTNQQVDDFFRQVPCMSCWHKWDREGRPVYIERLGMHQVHALVAKCKQMVPPGSPISAPVVEAHIHSNEVGGTITRFMASKQPGKNICQVTVIMDCTGLGMGHFYTPALDLLKVQSQSDQQHYPEGLSRVYVVNAPRIITVGWAIVKMWLDARVQKKVHFVPASQTTQKLLEILDEDALPKFLGGKCECEGECCPATKGELSDTDESAATQEIVVARGAKATRSFPIDEGHTFVWELALERRDLTITVTFTPEGCPNPPPPIQQFPRVGRASGTFTAPLKGTVTLTFDNSFAWLHGKTVLMRSSVIDQQAEAVQDSEAATETD
jgi:hypothetical protein